MPVKTIEETQKTLLYKSLLNSAPVIPQFLFEYEVELNLTADYKRNLEKIPILRDEIKNGSLIFIADIDATQVDAEAEN